MTKAELNKEYQSYLEQGVKPDMVILTLRTPTGEEELVINHNVTAKMDFINKAYSENLMSNVCTGVSITDVLFTVPDDGLLDFGNAIINIREGRRVARKGWNGTNQYVFLADNVQFDTGADISEFNDKDVLTGNMLVLRNAQGGFTPGWIPWTADLLADDWFVLPDAEDFADAPQNGD